MFRSKRKPMFAISIAQGVLDSIYDECDRFDRDETGEGSSGALKLPVIIATFRSGAF